MRVELAGIMFMTLLGLISQMKMWKIVRDRRRRKAVDRLARDKDADALEEAVGRKVEDDNARERLEWEALYGDRRHSDRLKRSSTSDDGAESVRKGPGTVIELRELGQGKADASSARDSFERVSLSGEPLSRVGQDGKLGNGTVSSASRTSEDVQEAGSHALRLGNSSPDLETGRASDTPAPMIVPLPFTVPTAVDTQGNRDGSSNSVSATSTSEVVMTSPKHPRLSSLKRLSVTAGYSPMKSKSEEALLNTDGDADDDEDQASSIAATVDERSEVDPNRPLALEMSPIQASGNENLPPIGTKQHDPASSLDGACSREEILVEAAALPLPSDSEIGSIDGDSDQASIGSKWQAQKYTSHAPHLSSHEATTNKSSVSSTSSQHSTPFRRLSKARLSTQLPNSASKVLLCYRTNEWAKHLDAAEQPEIEDLTPTADGVIVLDAATVQKRQPNAGKPQPILGVDEHPPATTGPPSVVDPETPKCASSSSITGSAENIQKQASPIEAAPTTAPSSLNRHRTRSLASLEGKGSTGTPTPSVRSLAISQTSSSRGMRSSSNPFPHHSMDGSSSRANGFRAFSQPSLSSLPAENTLISQRDHLMQNKYMPRSSTQLTPVLELDAQLTPNDSVSVSDAHRSSAEYDAASLSERSDLIQRQSSQQWLRQNIYQPKRHSDLDFQRRDAMMAHWRQSLRQHSINNRQPRPFDEDTREADVHLDRQQKLSNTRRSRVSSPQMDVLLDERMRQADMLELHRAAMKKMQAVADLHARS